MHKERASNFTPDEQTKPSSYQVVSTTGDIARTMQATIAAHITEVAVVKTTLHFAYSDKVTAPSHEHTQQSTLDFLHDLRPLVRKTDRVFLLDHAIYFILPGANSQGGSIVEERLWDALLWHLHNAQEVHDADVLPPHSVTMGHSASTWPCDDIQAVLQAAAVQRSFTLHHVSAVCQTTQTPVEPHLQQPEDSELRSLARELGIPYVTFLPRKLATKVRHLLNPQLALELHCYPLGRERDILTVAISDPHDRDALERLHQETGMHIFPVLAPPHELQTALEQLV